MLRLFLLLEPLSSSKTISLYRVCGVFVIFTSVFMLRVIGQLVGTQMRKISAGRIFFCFSP